MAAVAVQQISPDSTLGQLALGAIGGVVGMAVADALVTKATTMKTSGDNVFEDIKDVWNETGGTVVSMVGGLLSGGIWWYLYAAGAGAATNLLAGALTGGQVFPLVLSVGSGASLEAIYTWENPPIGDGSLNKQDCTDGDLVGCTITNSDGSVDTWGSIKNSVSNNYLFMASPIGWGYLAYKTLSDKIAP